MVHFSIKISSLVLMFLLFAASSYSSLPKVVPIDAICKQSTNASFCSQVLNSKAGADLVTLAQYTIDIVRGNVTNTISLIKSLIAHSGNDAKAKDHYKECLLHFDYDEGALGDIENTQNMLKSGDYLGVNSAASAVIADVDDCVSGEDPEDPTYPDKSKLPSYAKSIENLVDIILVISKLLLQIN